jgi:hypothetical protein
LLVLSSPYLKEIERVVRLLFSLIALAFGAGVVGALKAAEIPIPWWGHLLVLAAVWWARLTGAN